MASSCITAGIPPVFLMDRSAPRLIKLDLCAHIAGMKGVIKLVRRGSFISNPKSVANRLISEGLAPLV